MLIYEGSAMPVGIRSADAIHLGTAIRLETDVLVACDPGLVAAATEAGLSALSPGKAPKTGTAKRTADVGKAALRLAHRVGGTE